MYQLIRNEKNDKEVLEEIARIFGKHTVMKQNTIDASHRHTNYQQVPGTIEYLQFWTHDSLPDRQRLSIEKRLFRFKKKMTCVYLTL